MQRLPVNFLKISPIDYQSKVENLVFSNEKKGLKSKFYEKMTWPRASTA
jgi:hypothetical protein